MKLDLSGKRFGRLVAISCAGKNKYNKTLWLCKCDCGNEKAIALDQLTSGGTRSCGCLEYENRQMFGTRSKRTHEQTKTRLYRIWLGMKTRCYNKNDAHWKDYGSRGISVCEEWRNGFEAFRDWALKNGYDESLTIDRIDPNGGYAPSNCRWVTPADQQRNKRSNKYYTFRGKTQLIPAWAKEFGVTDSTLRSRIRRGENPQAVFEMFSSKEAI